MTKMRLLVGLLLVLGVVSGVGQAESKEQSHSLSVTVTKIGKKAPLSVPITLRSRVAWRGPAASIAYEWSTLSGAMPAGVDIYAKDLELRAGSLEPGQHYHFRLVVIATMEDAKEARASSDVQFVANEPPSGGDCTIKATPMLGGAVRLALAAPGWSDPDGVQYRFEARRGDRLLAAQNWRAFSTFEVIVHLKGGESVFGRCQIRDRFGDGLTKDTQPVSPK